jgi:osmotically-inducible protein OsmY
LERGNALKEEKKGDTYMAAGNRTDEDIQRDVLEESKWDIRVRPNEIGVVVKDGIVTLTGWATCSWIGRAPGTEPDVERSALTKKLLAASASRVGLNRNSRVLPSESTAR